MCLTESIKSKQRPVVILTSNRTRELHDALKRRCLYHWIDYPTFQKEMRIVEARVPGIQDRLSGQICRFMELIRQEDLYKRPGVAETIDWAQALLSLSADELDPDVVYATLGCILKFKGDIEKVQEANLKQLVDRALMSDGNAGYSSGPGN